MDSPGSSSRESSPDRSFVEQSLYHPPRLEGISVRPEGGQYKGYTIRAYDPQQAGPMLDLSLGVPNPDQLEEGCPIADRAAVTLHDVEPRMWLFEDSKYRQIVDLIDQYSRYPRSVTACREERIALLNELESVADQYLAQDSADARKKAFVQQQIKDQIPKEKRLLFGITHPYGKIYQPEDEAAAVENFAHGNSASIAKVTYRTGDEDDPRLITVFKASTIDQEVTAASARKFGIKGNSETARLSQRSVFFYELDQLTGMNLTPPTHYAIHNGQPGSCQEFVEGVHVTTRKDVEDPFREDDQEIAPGIIRGEYIDQGRGFRLGNHYRGAEAQLAKKPDHELRQLFLDKKVVLTREQVVDIPALDLRHPKTQKALADAQLLDHLAGSVDRNLSNIFFVKKTDESGQAYYDIRLIDNDLCAAPENVHDNVEAHSLINPYRINMAGRVPNFIDRETARRVKKLSFEEVYELLSCHQLGREEEIASQRERMSNCISAIWRALKSEDKKATVQYRHFVKAKEPAKDPDTGDYLIYDPVSKDVIAVKNPGPDAVLIYDDVFKEVISEEEIVIIDEWNDRTYQQAMANNDTYLCKANACRVSELSSMMDSDPARAAEIWGAQFHLMGGHPMAVSLGELPVLRKLSHFLSTQHPVQFRNAADYRRASEFAHTLVCQPRQRLTTPVEQQTNADGLYRMMLGDQTSAEEVGKALKGCTCLTAHTLMELFPQAVRSASRRPAANWNPAKMLKKQFPYMNLEGDYPPVAERMALAECLNGVHPDKGCKDMLRFWTLMTAFSVPGFMKQNKKLDIMACEEFKHAMALITPDVLKRLHTAPAKDRKAMIRQICFTPEEGLVPANVNTVINMLYHHFGVIEPKAKNNTLQPARK